MANDSAMNRNRVWHGSPRPHSRAAEDTPQTSSKGSGNTQQNMIIKVKTKQQVAIPPEATYDATVNSVTPKPNEAKPEKVIGGFKIDGYEKEIPTESSPSFILGSPLRTDTITILGRTLTTAESEKGMDLNLLIGKKCQIVVYHKSSSGGRPKPVVGNVLPAAVAS